jgi:broad specificity phosphatase PhoE
MSKTVFIIRHGEKRLQADDVHLSPKGYQRAGALSALFDAKRNGAAFPAIDVLLATACSKQSTARC